jgi:gamma-glutamylcyclotransferase (GGCT)/AIG2-like uncharacterized protein YtfP
MKNEEKILVAVYGSLRKNMGNHRLLEDAVYLGNFKTKPEFSLYSLGGFPGLKKRGNTEVTMEVYQITPGEAHRIDQLEGYDPKRNDNYFYDKIEIETPYGAAGTYIYVGEVSEDRLVESGDWTEFRTQMKNSLARSM